VPLPVSGRSNTTAAHGRRTWRPASVLLGFPFGAGHFSPSPSRFNPVKTGHKSSRPAAADGPGGRFPCHPRRPPPTVPGSREGRPASGQCRVDPEIHRGFLP
jgi:hypothetical protein